MVISARQAAPARTIPMVPVARQQGDFLTLCYAILSHLPPPTARPSGQDLARIWCGGWGWGRGESNPEAPEQGRMGNAVATENPDLRRFNFPQNGTKADMPGGPGLPLETKQRTRRLVPALQGLTEQRRKQSRPQTRLQCRERRTEPREVLGGWEGLRGVPSPALAGGTVALLLAPEQSPVHAGVKSVCWLNESEDREDGSKSEQHVKVQLRSCTPPGCCLRPPCYHSYQCTCHSLPCSSRAETVWYLCIPNTSMCLVPQGTSHCSRDLTF